MTDQSLNETEQECSDRLTLYERESDGQRSMKVGDHGDHLQIQDEEITQLTAVAVAKLDEPVTHDELLDMDGCDLPDLVNDFFDREEIEDGN